MATSFINSPISLTSVADIRYRGILTNIDHEAATLGLSNVYSMGTENRRSPEEYIPPQPMPYDYVVFRASEVQNLAVDTEPRPQPRSTTNDPAVSGDPLAPSQPQLQQTPRQNGQPYTKSVAQPVAAPHPVPAPKPLAPVPQPVTQPVLQPVPATSTSRSPSDDVQPQTQPESKPQQSKSRPQTAHVQPRPAVAESLPVRSASTSLEAVEKALTDLRVSIPSSRTSHHASVTGRGQYPRRGGGSGRGRGRGGLVPHSVPVVIPREDFDFVESNSKFDKAALYATKSPSTVDSPDLPGNGSAESLEPGQIVEEKKELRKFYDRSRSFFDDISSDANVKDGDVGRGRGRGGRGMGRSRRDEERTKNLTTFGETGVNIGGGAYWQGGNNPVGRGGYRGRRRRAYNANNQVRQEVAQQISG